MPKSELIRRYYNLVTGSDFDKLEKIPTDIINLINSHNNFQLLSLLVLNDFKKSKNVTRRSIMQKYSVSERTARNLFDKHKTIKLINRTN